MLRTSQPLSRLILHAESCNLTLFLQEQPVTSHCRRTATLAAARAPPSARRPPAPRSARPRGGQGAAGPCGLALPALPAPRTQSHEAATAGLRARGVATARGDAGRGRADDGARSRHGPRATSWAREPGARREGPEVPVSPSRGGGGVGPGLPPPPPARERSGTRGRSQERARARPHARLRLRLRPRPGPFLFPLGVGRARPSAPAPRAPPCPGPAPPTCAAPPGLQQGRRRPSSWAKGEGGNPPL